jgi:DNA repair exonuclease SbcCD nuclease subunit
MKIAVTADVHLRTRDSHPERYNALEDVFEQTVEAGVEHLIIAGDLFDKDFQNYSEFESLCREHCALQLHIIPGNHDPSISAKSITGDNIHIYTIPTVVEFDSVPFLFIPYEEGAKMGEKIAEMEHDIDEKQWVLVGLGDFYGGVKEPNPLEPGTYMPLSRSDIGRFKPASVFLGHIHKPHDPSDRVTYVGSPCGLDISEDGRRTFVVYDTAEGTFERHVIETDVLYFSESFLVLPRDSEVTLLKQEIEIRIEEWDIAPSDHQKIQVRVRASGYAKDRSAIHRALESGFDGFRYFKDEGPNIEDLSVSTDDQLEAISERTMKLIEQLDWSFGGDEPTPEQVELAALSVIYGN